VLAGAERVVAVDVGGTNLKAALIDARGRELSVKRRATCASQGPDAVCDTVLAFAAELADSAPAPVAVGFAVPGIVQDSTGTVVTAANLGWRDLPLAQLARERLGLAVSVSHDVRAGALAEGLLGAARGCRDFLFVTLGTGIGAAVVLGGRPYTGAHGRGGELGHTVVQPGGPICGCGGEGCLEAVASAGHIASRYRAIIGSGEASLGAEEVLERTAGGDPVAVRVWTDAVDALARAIASYTMLLDPERVVIGGGLIAAGERLFGPLRAGVSSLLRLNDPPPLAPARLKEACRDGAAIAAWRMAGIEERDLALWER
jgi:glucokinase